MLSYLTIGKRVLKIQIRNNFNRKINIKMSCFDIGYSYFIGKNVKREINKMVEKSN